MPTAELAIPGAHNVSNALAAIAVALAFGLEPAAIRGAAAAFHGVEHRLDTVAEVLPAVRGDQHEFPCAIDPGESAGLESPLLQPVHYVEQGVDTGISRDKNSLRRGPLRQEVPARPFGGRKM